MFSDLRSSNKKHTLKSDSNIRYAPGEARYLQHASTQHDKMKISSLANGEPYEVRERKEFRTERIENDYHKMEGGGYIDDAWGNRVVRFQITTT